MEKPSINMSLIDPKTVKYIGYGLGTIIVLGGGYYGYSKWKKNKERKEVANDYTQTVEKEVKQSDGTTKTVHVPTSKAIATQLASEFYSSFFTTGFTWIPDGTDEDAIGLAAQKMFDEKVSFLDVSNSYKLQFNRDLNKDLTDELSANVKRNFNLILQGKKKIQKTAWYEVGAYKLVDGSLAGLQGLNPMITTTAPTKVYNLKNQLVAVTPKGKKIGYLTSTVDTGLLTVYLFENRGQTLAVKGQSTLKFQ